MLKIGISACFFHADPKRPIFKGKTLLYLEQSLSYWVNSQNALAFLIPPPNPLTSIHVRDLVREMDGLILEGGSDVSPSSYGETPIKPEWNGDSIRDIYEMDLLREFLNQKKPILGVCRGAQLMNVAFGGTLYQDIDTQVSQPKASQNKSPLVHRNWEIYDHCSHSIQFESRSLLQEMYPDLRTAKVNSIHHQAIKDLGQNLEIEARADDGIIEAIRLKSETFVYAVQWHPEFHDPQDRSFLDSAPVLKKFLHEVRLRKE